MAYPTSTNGRTADALLDPRTGAHVSMSNEHRQIHASNAWAFTLTSLALAKGGVLLIQIRVGAKAMHLKELRVWGDSAAAQSELVESPALTTGTTAVPMLNMNRADGAAAPTGVTMFSDPTGISAGTALYDRLFGAGAGVGQVVSAGVDHADREWVLAASTRYLIRITNLEANARNFCVDGMFYLED